VVKDRGGPRRLDRVRRRVRPGLKAAARAYLGRRGHAGGDGDRLQQQARLPGWAGRGQARLPPAADLPRAQDPPPPWLGSAQGVHQDRLRPAAGRRTPAAQGANHPGMDNLNTHRSASMAGLIAAGLAARRLAPAVCARAQPGRASLVAPEKICSLPGQTKPRPAHRPGQDLAAADAVPASAAGRLPRQHQA
jgi:hypothetical protein